MIAVLGPAQTNHTKRGNNPCDIGLIAEERQEASEAQHMYSSVCSKHHPSVSIYVMSREMRG